MRRVKLLCIAAGFALSSIMLLGLWLVTNHVEITISTEDQRQIATDYERNDMADFAYHCQTHIRF